MSWDSKRSVVKPPTPVRRLKMWWGDYSLGILIGIIVLFILWFAVSLSQHRQAFMDECLQDRKQYECTAMWMGR